MTDFYMLAGTVIPILGLALVIEVRQPVVASIAQAHSRPKIRKLLGFAYAVLALVTFGLSASAEYACLRSVETGKSTGGGHPIVWIDIAFAFTLIALREILRAVSWGRGDLDSPAG